MLTKQQVEDIFNSVNSCEDLKGVNIIDRIKEQLKLQNQNVYEEWEKNGFNINQHFEFGSLFHKTLLHWAAENDYVEIVKVLIDSGANVDEIDEHPGYTPLHLAAQGGHVEAIASLIDLGAKIDKEDKYGNTSLHWAAIFGYKVASH